MAFLAKAVWSGFVKRDMLVLNLWSIWAEVSREIGFLALSMTVVF